MSEGVPRPKNIVPEGQPARKRGFPRGLVATNLARSKHNLGHLENSTMTARIPHSSTTAQLGKDKDIFFSHFLATK